MTRHSESVPRGFRQPASRTTVCCYREARGFTLVELLVVIAVIALLTAISIPVLQAVRQRARTMLCAANQRQLLFAFELYQQETEVFPYGFCDKGLGTTMAEPTEGYAGDGKDKKGWWWFNYLQNVVEIDLGEGGIAWQSLIGIQR